MASFATARSEVGAALAALWLGLAAGPAAGAVTDAGALCPGNPDPCRVNTTIDVADGAVLDLGARTLEVLANGRLDVGAGSMTIAAGAMRVRAGGRVTGFGGRIIIQTSGPIETEAMSRIDVSAPAAGLISLEAVGDVTLAGILDAHSGAGADGGFVAVSGAAVAMHSTGRALVGSESGAGGGVIFRAAGPLVVDAPLDATGGAGGGGIDCDAETVVLNGRIDVSGGGGGGGALVDLRARGAVVVNGVLDGDARGSDAAGGGLAAEVSIDTQGPVELNGMITLTGGAPGGEGGLIDVVAGGDVTQRGSIEARGLGQGGVGGEVRLAADGGVTLGDIDVGAADIANRVLVTSGGIVRLTGVLAAEPNAGGFGGVVDVTACALDMDSAARVSTVGTEGRTTLTSRGQMILRGSLAAGLENVLTIRDAASPPLILGTITPSPTTRIDPLLPVCELQPGPGSTTTTTLPPGECSDPALAPYDALLCRLSAISLTIETSSPASLGGKRTARSLRRRAGRVLAAVEIARSGERVAKKLGVASVQLARLLARVQRRLAQGRFDPTIATRLMDLGNTAASEIEALRFQTSPA